MTDRAPRWGAYGLHLDPCPSSRWLVPAPEHWPTVRLHEAPPDGVAVPSSHEVQATLVGRTATVETGAGWRLRVDLEGPTATYRGIGLAEPEFVHPGLAATAAMMSRSWGHEAFHAGAFVVDGRAWGVVGAREAGKTTLLACLARRGVPVLADDLVVVADGEVLAGPRCLDLREPRGAGLRTTRVRDGLRHRLTLPPVPATTRLAGWVFLEWGPCLAVDELRSRTGCVAWPMRPRGWCSRKTLSSCSTPPHCLASSSVAPDLATSWPR